MEHENQTAAGSDPAAAGTQHASDEAHRQSRPAVIRSLGDPAPKGNPNPAIQFLTRFIGDPAEAQWVLSALDPHGNFPTATFDNAKGAADWIESKDRQTANIYFQPATARDRRVKKALKEDVASSRWLWADADPIKLHRDIVPTMSKEAIGQHYKEQREQILACIKKLNPAPSVVIDSGNGYQVFWQLTEPLADHDAIEGRNRWVGSLIGAWADHTWNVDRVMRLPGTRNVPTEKKLKAGITWTRMASVVEELSTWAEHPADAFQYLPPTDKVPASDVSHGYGTIPQDLPVIESLEAIKALQGEQHASLRHLILKGHRPNFDPAYSTRSEAVFAAVRDMLLAGVDLGTICAVLLDERFAISESVLEKGRKKRAYAERQVEQAIAKSRKPNAQDDRRPDDAANAEALARLNEKHFIAVESGQTRIYTEENDPERARIVLWRSTQQDFNLLYANHLVLTAKDDGGVEQKQLGQWWIANKRRRQYKRIAFLPGAEADDTTYNLWRDFAVDPKPGDWSLLKQHIFEVICNGNQGDYDYVLGWMARKIQKPGQQGWAALVFRGDEGIGKGIVCSEFGKLFGQHYLHISHSKHLVGNFNLHLRDCCLLFADEAFWAGDKQGESTLKMIVTEPEIPIEGKGRDVIMGKNHIGLVMASNHDWVIPAGPSARRFAVFDVNDSRKDDRSYFNAIVKQMDNGGREAMLHELKHRDILKFEVRDIPKGSALLRQKIQTLRGVKKWVYEVANRGRLAAHHDEWWTAPVLKDVIYNDYQQMMHATASRGERAMQTEIGKALKKLLKPLGGDYPKVIQGWVDQDDGHGGTKQKNRQHWEFPSLADFRAAVAKSLDADAADFDWHDDPPCDDPPTDESFNF